MADILCPLCGKPNPEEQEICRYCQAPLKDSAFIAAPAEGEELPDWLREAVPPSEVAPPASATGEPTTEPAAGEEVPDWLGSLLPSTAKPADSPADSDEVIPEWLASLNEFDQPGPVSDEQAVPSAESEELPEWLARLQGTLPEQPTGSVPAFIFDEEASPEELVGADDQLLATLPDWASQIAAEQAEEPAAEPEPGLAPAELPGWLEAMRPLETTPPTTPLEDLSGAEMVAAGPLTGLRGVLSSEPDAIRARKPAAHTLKLRVTEEQRARLTLLEELLAGEQQPKQLPPSPSITPQYLFRLLVAAVLLIPIIWVVVKQPSFTRLPAGEEHPTVLDFDASIRRLNEGDPVLLAIDYEAGYLGEMESAANVVMSRLAEQGAYLVMVSTNTTGPALGERLLSTLNAGLDEPYTAAGNLGYLPGGVLGLSALVGSPRQLLPYTLAPADPWTAPPLDTVSSLADFSMVIVFANDADTSRAWIEQAGPALQDGDVPLLLVVSAQAEPLVRPYTEGTAPPVSAMLGGLPDSAAFENMTTRYAVGRHELWDAFSLSLPIAAMVILIGSLAGAAITAIKQGLPGAQNSQPPRAKTEPKQEQP